MRSKSFSICSKLSSRLGATILLLSLSLLLVTCRKGYPPATAPASKPAPALLILPTDLLRAIIGDRLKVRLQVSGGTAPYTWLLGAGKLPTGVSISSAGVVSGTVANPTAIDGSTCSVTSPPGSCTYTAQVSVTDAVKQTASASVSITVPLLPLKITTTSLPNGTVGTAYNAQIAATGGLPAQ